MPQREFDITISPDGSVEILGDESVGRAWISLGGN